MELKKSPKVDLQRQKGLFLLIGLASVLIIMLIAFEWGTREIEIQKMTFESDIVQEDEIINTEQEEQKPMEQPPVPVLSDVLVVVDDNIKLADNMSLFDSETDDKSGFAIMDFQDEEEEVLEDDIPFTAVEEPASFRGGGVDAFRRWIGENMKYPESASENGIQGRVIMQFTVATDGRVVNVKILRGIDPALDKEAARVIASSPKWTPGKQRNKPVRILYTLPVIFTLQ
ncbi:MAG: energy transducer TonB [Bacteroidales bacterium]